MTPDVAARPCTKKNFTSEFMANDWIEGKRRKHRVWAKGNKYTAYKCPYCRYWHLTTAKQG